MKKNLLKSILMTVALILGTTGAWAADGNAVVKMTYVDYDNPTTAIGEIAAGETSKAGYNKISGGSVGFGNTGWGENKITYIQVDASAIEGTITGATLTAEVSGIDGKRFGVYGVGYNASTWSADLTYETADKTITTVGKTYTTSTKKNTEFETATFDISNALVGDEDKVVTLLMYDTNPGCGYIKNPTVTVTYLDASQAATYTVKYVCGETEVKEATTGTGAIGSFYTVTEDDKASCMFNDVKYIYVSDDAASQAIADDGSTVITVTFREAEKYNYTLKSSLGGIIKEGTDWEGNTTNVAYPRYLAQDGTLYSAGNGSAGWYLHTFDMSQNNVEATIDYTATETTGVVFIAEAEDIETLTVSTAANSTVRCSNGLGAYNAGEGDALIANLPNGKYKLYTSTWGGTGVNFTFKAGETTVGTFECFGYIQDYNTEEFELNAASTPITLGATENPARCIDFVYIVKTGDAELAAPVAATGKMTFDGQPTSNNGNEGDITEDKVLTADEFTVTVSPKASGTVNNRFWLNGTTTELRIYNGTLTVKAAAGKTLTKIVFEKGNKWTNPTANVGTFDGQTWTGEAEEVVFTVTAQCQIKSITVGEFVEPVVDAANIAAFKALTAGTRAKLAVNGAKVTFSKGDNTYIEDETGALLLYKTGLTMTAGKAITGFINGAYTDFKGLAELTAIDVTPASEFTEADTELTATVMTVAEASDVANASKLVKLENVTINADYQTIAQGENEISFYDKFSVMTDYTYPTVAKSIVGIINTNSGYNTFCPVSPDSVVAGEVVIPEVANIAAAKAEDVRGTEIKLNVTGAKVTLYGGNNMMESFIEDETGALMVDFNISKLLGEDGVTLTGYIIGKITKNQRQGGIFTFEGTDNTASSEITAKEPTEIVPTATTIADINAGQVADVTSKFISLENVNVKYEDNGWSADISLVDGDQELYVNDAMFVLPQDMSVIEKFNKISGIVTYGYYGLEFIPYGAYDAVEKQIEFTNVANIAALKDIANNTDVKLALNNTQIKVLEGGRWSKAIYIEDETAGIQINDNEGTIFNEFGQTFNGYIYLKYKDEYGVKNLETAGYTHNSEYTVEVKEVVAKEVAWADATNAKYNQMLIKVNNVELASKTITEGEGENTHSYDILYLKSGDKEMELADMFNKAYNEQGGSLEPGMYNITGIIMGTPVYNDNDEVIGNTDSFIPTGETAFEKVEEPEPVADLRKWDFTAWSDETKANLAADAATVVPTDNGDGTFTYPAVTPWRSYEKVGGPTETDPDREGNAYWYGTAIDGSEELVANNVVIAETKGLLFNKMTAGSLAIGINYPETTLGTYEGPSYLWIGGKNNSFTIPSVKSGAKISLGVESHKNTDARGVKLTINGEEIGSAVPTTYEVFNISVPGALTDETFSDVVVTNTNGCHIYFITVDATTGGGDGINDLNAVVKTINNDVYTINGVKVRNAGESLDGLAKGLYIIGGKKVVVK